MIKLHVILASTRPGRAGKPIADWFTSVASKDARFETKLVDLKEVNLPFLDEPEHPRFKRYTQQHTKDWSALVDAADAFVFVTCEYNYGYPATLKNAIDFVYQEWGHKPIGFVGYGGASGGTRAIQQLRQVAGAVQLVSVAESVIIPMFSQFLKEGTFAPPEAQEKSAHGMLDALARYADALRPLRAPR